MRLLPGWQSASRVMLFSALSHEGLALPSLLPCRRMVHPR